MVLLLAINIFKSIFIKGFESGNSNHLLLKMVYTTKKSSKLIIFCIRSKARANKASEGKKDECETGVEEAPWYAPSRSHYTHTYITFLYRSYIINCRNSFYVLILALN